MGHPILQITSPSIFTSSQILTTLINAVLFNYRRKLNNLDNYQRNHIPSISKAGFLPPAAAAGAGGAGGAGGGDPSNPCGKPPPLPVVEPQLQNEYNTMCNSMISNPHSMISNPHSMITNPHACTPLSSPIDVNMENDYDLFLYNTGCSKPCPSVYNAYTMSASRKTPSSNVTRSQNVPDSSMPVERSLLPLFSGQEPYFDLDPDLVPPGGNKCAQTTGK